MAALRAGNWRGKTLPALGHDPQGKVLGILGMGGIGRNVAAKARAFGMRIRYHNRSRLSPDLEDGAEYVDVDTLLKESDVLSLNLPLNVSAPPLPSSPEAVSWPSTQSLLYYLHEPRPAQNPSHNLSPPICQVMKKGIVIVNTARGAVMDEAALVDALDAGQVASVGLDVYEDEPEIHSWSPRQRQSAPGPTHGHLDRGDADQRWRSGPSATSAWPSTMPSLRSIVL